MQAIYNEIEPFAAEWLRNLIAAGHLPRGVVDGRSIKELTPADLAGPGQRHFFAGIGVWAAALRAAGFSDLASVWTGSCPCQPFSDAGAGDGFADERHLWPDWFKLIQIGRPEVILGEQVASPDGLAWLDLVSADLEGEGYAVGAFDLCAAGFGAPHIRQRLYFCAVRLADPAREQSPRGSGSASPPEGLRGGVERRGETGSGGLGDADGEHPRGYAGASARSERGPELRPVGDEPRAPGAVGWVGDAERARLEARPVAAPGPTNGHWADVEWLPCRDGKARPTKPGLFPLAHGSVGRVGCLRAYGNAIVLPQAIEFCVAVRLFLEAHGLTALFSR